MSSGMRGLSGAGGPGSGDGDGVSHPQLSIDMFDPPDVLGNSDEQVLVAHNQKFQQAVLKAMEESVGTLETQQNVKILSLQEANNAREMMAQGLQNMRGEFRRQQKEQDRNRKECSEAIESRKNALTMLARTQDLLHATEKSSKEMESELRACKGSLEQSKKREFELRKLYEAWESKDRVNVQLQQSQISDLHSKDAVQAHQREEYTKVKQQRDQASVEQVIANEEKEALLKSNRLHLDQEKRDEVQIDTLETDLSAARKKADKLLLIIKTQESERVYLEGELAKAKQREAYAEQKGRGQDGAQSEQSQELSEQKLKVERYMSLNDSLVSLSHQHTEEQKRTRQQVDQFDLEKKQLASELRDALLRVDKLQDAKILAVGQVNELRVELREKKMQYDRLSDEKNRHDVQTGVAVDKMRSSMENTLESVQEKQVSLENERNMTKLKLQALETRNSELQVQNQVLENEMQALQTELKSVHRSKNQTETVMERAVYIGKKEEQLRARLEEEWKVKYEQVVALKQFEVEAVEKKLKEQVRLHEVQSALYVDSQREQVKIQENSSKKVNSEDTVHSKLKLSQAVNDRQKREFDKKQSEYLDIVKEGELTKLTLSQRSNQVSSLQAQVTQLERALEELQYTQREQQHHSKSEETVHNFSLARSRNDNHDLKSLLQLAHADRLNSETHTILAREKLHLTERRLQEAHDTIATLRQTIRKLETNKTADERNQRVWEQQFAHIFERAVHSRMKTVLHGREVKKGPSAATTTAGATTTISDKLQDSSFVKVIINELKGELHKALVAGHQQAQEVTRLKQQLLDLEEKGGAVSSSSSSSNSNSMQQRVQQVLGGRQEVMGQLNKEKSKREHLVTVIGGLEQKICQLLHVTKADMYRIDWRELVQPCQPSEGLSKYIDSDISSSNNDNPDLSLPMDDTTKPHATSNPNIPSLSNSNNINNNNNSNNNNTLQPKTFAPFVPLQAPTVLQKYVSTSNTTGAAGAINTQFKIPQKIIVASTSQKSLWTNSNTSSTSSLHHKQELRTNTSAPVLLPVLTPTKQPQTKTLTKTPSLTSDMLRKMIR